MLNLKPWLVLALIVPLAGCLGAPAVPVPEGPPPEVQAPLPAGSQSDQVLLEEAVRGRAMSNAEVAGLCDRLLSNGNTAFNDEKTMARLEILLLKALKSPDKASRPALLRNLGVIHYHQGKYKKARQELQNSNELNPRDARTHFYLARLFAQQGEIYQRQGKKGPARQQFKRASIEMEMARKLAPNNATYRQDIQQIIRQDPGK